MFFTRICWKGRIILNNGWSEVCLNSVDEILAKFIEFRNNTRRWVYRGMHDDYLQPLLPSFDRYTRCVGDRKTKINLERQSIELFRSTYTQLAIEEDRDYLRKDITTLMLMQHYGGPTRLLDWSLSPYIAAYFAICEGDDSDGFIWSFDYDRYEEMGPKQWYAFPEMYEENNFKTLAPAFCVDYPAYNADLKDKNWIVCQFVLNDRFKFNRIRNQEGLFTFASQFDIDHSQALRELLDGSEYHIVYRIRKEDKKPLRKYLYDKCQIWHGMMYPDVVGAAEAVKERLKDLVCP